MNYNSFCIFCVGQHHPRLSKEIERCEFRDCPFYRDRLADFDHDDEVEISKKLLGEVGVVHEKS